MATAPTLSLIDPDQPDLGHVPTHGRAAVAREMARSDEPSSKPPAGCWVIPEEGVVSPEHSGGPVRHAGAAGGVEGGGHCHPQVRLLKPPCACGRSGDSFQCRCSPGGLGRGRDSEFVTSPRALARPRPHSRRALRCPRPHNGLMTALESRRGRLRRRRPLGLGLPLSQHLPVVVFLRTRRRFLFSSRFVVPYLTLVV